MFRLLISIASFAMLSYGGWQAWHSWPPLKDFVQEYIGLGSGQFYTLEAQYTPEQLMDNARPELLKTMDHSYLKPSLEFHPYLLMEVKFSQNKNSTAEGIILWNQRDGEMILNTKTWSKTHGFEDCINAKASNKDFKILNTLAKYGGQASKEQIMNSLYVENHALENWLESSLNKHLIVLSGSKYRLHFENPKFNISPQTQIDQRFVTKQYGGAERLPSQYSESEIRRIAQAAFGNDFAIRKINQVFLPVYSIKVKNPDGTIHTSYWNALNGKIVAPSHL